MDKMMNSKVKEHVLKGKVSIIIVLFQCLLIFSCYKVEDLQPKSDFEKSTGELPKFNLNLDTNNLMQIVRFDSIAQGGNFQLSFTPLKFGVIKITEGGKAVEFAMFKSNWKQDSSRYKICKNNVCREGNIIFKNKSFYIKEPIDVDSSCAFLPLRTFNVPFSGSLHIKNLFPTAIK